MRLSNFSRRSGSIAASSRTSLSRVFHFAYLLQPMPITRTAEMTQTVMSVEVTEGIKNRKGKRRPNKIILPFRNRVQATSSESSDKFDLPEPGRRFSRARPPRNYRRFVYDNRVLFDNQPLELRLRSHRVNTKNVFG